VPVDATAYLAPFAPRRVRRPVLLEQTEQTYPLEASPGESWLPIAFRAFARIAERNLPRVQALLILGSGNGLDALGAADIFDLRSLAVTDLSAQCVATICQNVLNNLRSDAALELSFHAGDLFSGIAPECEFDLVYENLPNIPASEKLRDELHLGTHSGRFFDARGVEVPPPFGDYLLALHFRCLIEARTYVRSGGGVLTAIGGRMPDEVAFGLHTACGYSPELIAFDVKLQAEPELVLPGYRRAEEQRGVAFRYYAAEAVEITAHARQSGLEGQQLKDAVDAQLANLEMTASQADRLSQQGRRVAHSVLMILGLHPSPAERAPRA
jgi:hypothetical protein